MTTSRVVCRIEKLKMSGLSGAQKHNEREFDVPNADSKKSDLNKRLIGDGHLRDLVLNRINSCGAKIINSGQNASNVAIEIVLSASPQYFRDNPDDYGVFEKDKLDVWVSKNVDFLKLKYGDNLVCVDLHLDEATPHLHAIVTPLIEKERNRRRTKQQIANNEKANTYKIFSLDSKTMFNRTALIDLQTDAARAVESIGISRGVKGSKADHQSLKQFYKTVDVDLAVNKIKPPNIPQLSTLQILQANHHIDSFNHRLNQWYEHLSGEVKDLVALNERLREKNKALESSLDVYIKLGSPDEMSLMHNEYQQYQSCGTVYDVQYWKKFSDQMDELPKLRHTISRMEKTRDFNYDRIDELEKEIKSLDISNSRAMFFLSKMPKEIRDLMHRDLKQDLDDYCRSFAPHDRPYELDEPTLETPPEVEVTYDNSPDFDF